jgi:hypothetical protein
VPRRREDEYCPPEPRANPPLVALPPRLVPAPRPSEVPPAPSHTKATAPWAPRFVHSEGTLRDTDIPNVVTPQTLLFTLERIAKGEAFAGTAFGQLLTLRRPGLVSAGHGPTPIYLSGTELAIRWFFARANAGEPPVAGKLSAYESLIEEGGTDRIVSPYHRPRRWSTTTSGDVYIVLGAELTHTGATPINLRDSLMEIGGFFEGWRYHYDSEGRIPDWAQFLALQSAR